MATWVLQEPKWHQMLLQLLSHFQEQGILCDTVLACANGQTIKAHSCVLAAASERIRNLLSGVQSGDYTLQMGSVTSTTWHYVLRFIYDGRVTLPSDQVERVKDAAIRFQIVPLINLLNTLEKVKGRNAAAESNRGAKTSKACADKDDVIILDDDDDDDNNGGDMLVDREINVASSIATPVVDVTTSDCVESSPSLNTYCPTLYNLLMSEDMNPSNSVLHLPDTSLDDNVSHCANTSLANPLTTNMSLPVSETDETGTSDRVSADINLQHTDFNNGATNSYRSTQHLSDMQNVSSYTTSDGGRCSSPDAPETFDIDEIICMDSPASSRSQGEKNATEKTCYRSEVVLEKNSSGIQRDSCNITAPEEVSSFVQAPFAVPNPVSDIYSQFVVSRPSEVKRAVDANTKRSSDTPVELDLETVANDCVSVHKPTVSEDHCGLGNGPQNGPENGLQSGPENGLQDGPSEETMEDETPLLCISNVVSLSGQQTDFFESDTPSVNSGNSLGNSSATSKAETATDDSRTRLTRVTDGSGALTDVTSMSLPTIQENPSLNSAVERPHVEETAQKTQVSEFVPQAQVPLPTAASHVKPSSGNVLPVANVPSTFGVPNLRVSILPNSVISASLSLPTLRFCVVSTKTSETASAPPPMHNSRNSKAFPLQNSLFSNIRLVSMPRVSLCSTLPQSMASSLSGSAKGLPVPPSAPVPDSLVPAPPVLKFPNSQPVKTTDPKSPGKVILFRRRGRAKKTPTSVVPPKNPYSFSQSTATKTKKSQQFKKTIYLKIRQKQQKTATPVETAETLSTQPDNMTHYTWPGDSGQFNGCTKPVTDHDYPCRPQTDQSSTTGKVLRLRESQHAPEPPSVPGPSGTSDSQVVGNGLADETSFMQPDSTVRDRQALQPEKNFYNFTDSDNEGNVLLPGRPQSSVTSTQPSETLNSGAKVAKPKGKKPILKPLSKPTPQKTAKQKLPRDDKPSKKPKSSRKHTVQKESGGPASKDDPPPRVQFVGRDIRHEWVVRTEPRETTWYNGKVLRVVNGEDGERDSQYEVQYEGDDNKYLIDHLWEDYLDGSLRLV